jgi:hypothetical protein
LGGAVFLRAGSVRLSASALTGNQSAGGAGGAGKENNSNGTAGQGKGGALFVSTGASLLSAGATFSGNNAPDAGTGPTDNNDVYGSVGILTDTAPPVVTVPADLTLEATGPGGRAVTFTASATDATPANPTVTCTPASGSTFAIGTTTVTCSATDAAGNTGSKSFAVTIRDTTVPTLSLPANLTLEATGPAGATVSYQASASDLVDGPRTPTCTPASGSTFAIGTTTVTCSATDTRGNTASGGFTVTVQDTTAPAISGTPANITAEATGPAGTAVSFAAPTASDLVDGSRPVICTPASGSTFALGATTVTCSASDTRGNSASTSFTVTVQDTTRPTLALPANLTRDATGPSGTAVSFTASANDLVDGARPVTCAPASGSTFAIGTTTVTCSASDTRGNSASASFTVTVTSASQQMTALLTKVRNLPLDPVTRNNLISILQNANASIATGDIAGACDKLSSFIAQVKAQSGKKIATLAADDLIADAQRIRAVIGCS